MPYKSKEKQKEYKRNWMRKLRAKLKREEGSVKKEGKKLRAKTDFERLQSLKEEIPKREIPKSEKRAIQKVIKDKELGRSGKPIWLGKGFDLWHENPQKEEISDIEKELLKEMFSEPTYEKSEPYNWKEDLEAQIDRIAPKKKKEEGEEEENG